MPWYPLEGVPRFTGKTRITGKTAEIRKDQRIYSWTIVCTRDQTNLRFTRAFTAAIKAQMSLCLPHAPLPNIQCYFHKFPNWLIQDTGQFMINSLVN